jgi:predicted enzyme related to lactoylglutathione lyase
MPTRDDAPNGAPCWVDLFTTDTKVARSFYGEVFGWTSEEAGEEYGGYINFSKDGVQVAGCMFNDGSSGMPSVWSVYLASADIDATAKSAAAHGAQTIVPPMAVGELGSMAVLLDAGQAAIGVWQPGLHRGFGIIGETGAPSWFELLTRDYAASLDFYRDVFGWTTSTASDTPEFRYSIAEEGGEQLAGVMDASGFLPEGVPAHWSVYFSVADADATVAKIVSLGGAVIMPAEDTPYGRLAAVADPTGAMFKLQQPPV